MSDLAEKLVETKNFGSFVTRSGSDIKAEYEIQANKVIIETICKAMFYKIEYNTLAGTITENSTLVTASKLGN